MRLFAGIWPPAAAVESLDGIREDLCRRSPPGLLRWTPPAQIHLTLSFLGEVPEAKLPEVEAALRGAVTGCGTLAVRLSGLGAFPDRMRARIVWVGLEGELDRLTELQSRLAAAMETFVRRPDSQPFHPHLTLARVRDARAGERRQLADALAGCKRHAPFAWVASSVRLMRSELRPDGATYSVIVEVPLGPG